MNRLLDTGYSAKTETGMSVTVDGSEVAYNGFFKMFRYRLSHSLFNGGMSDIFTREVMDRPDAVAVLLHDPVSQEVVLVKQFRVGALNSGNAWLEELVAGIVEPGEDLLDVARRETLEETGITLEGDLQKIGAYYNSAGGSSEKTTVFYAEIDAKNAGGIHGLDSENEDILVVKKSVSDFLTTVGLCKTDTSSALIGGLWLKSKLG